MEVSGPLLQAAAPATVSLEQQLYTEEVAQIRASDLLDPQKQQGIKRLTYEFIRRLRHRPLQSPSAQSFFSQLDIRIRITAFSALSYVNMLLFPSRNGVSIERHLIAIRAILTPRAQYYLSTLIRKFPRRDEIEACFNNMGINIYSEGLEGIKKAIEDRTPSKEDIEITAQVIKKELKRLNIDYKFPVFSKDNYQQELFETINKEGFPKDAITKLQFWEESIKVVPNILGAFTNLTELIFPFCPNLETPPDVRNNPALTMLWFKLCRSLLAAPDLRNNPALTESDFQGCTSLTSPPDLSGNQELEALYFSGCTSLIAPPDLRNNQALLYLSFKGCTSLTTPPDLSGNKKLWYLSLEDCTSLQTTPDLRNNQVLTQLSFKGCSNLTAPPDLSTLTQLSYLCTTGVFPEESGLNRNVYGNLEEAQALRRAIETYRLSLLTREREPNREAEGVNPIPTTEPTGEIEISQAITVFDHLTIFFTETIPNFFRAIADFFKNLFDQ